MTDRKTTADFVTGFSTGWPEHEPQILILSLSTHKGVHDFAFSKEQALLVARTMQQTAEHLGKPKTT